MYTSSPYVAEGKEMLAKMLDNIKRYGKDYGLVYLMHKKMSFFDKVRMFGLGMAIVTCFMEAYKVEVAYRDEFTAAQINKVVFKDC